MFWLIGLCALLSMAAIGLAIGWHYARYRQTSADQTNDAHLAHDKALYARAVADAERRAVRGEIDADEAREEQAEAARALIRAADVSAPPPLIPLHAFTAMAIASALALGLYIVLGFPEYADQPFAERLKQWRTVAAADITALPPEALAAVVRAEEKGAGNDIAYWTVRGHAELEAGQYYAASRAFMMAYRLDGDGFSDWYAWGQAMTAQAGRVTQDAELAFRRALQRDPGDARVNYYLGRAAFEKGDYEVALAELAVVRKALPAGTAAVDALDEEIAGVTRARDNARACIGRPDPRAMVASLEARLKTDPENPEGWARLLRAYAVLNDSGGYADTLLAVQKQYANRPGMIQEIMEKSQAPVGQENMGEGGQ